MLYTVYSVPYTVYSVHCTVYSVQCNVYGVQCSVQCIGGSVQFTVYSESVDAQCGAFAVCTMCSVQFKQCTVC